MQFQMRVCNAFFLSLSGPVAEWEILHPRWHDPINNRTPIRRCMMGISSHNDRESIGLSQAASAYSSSLGLVWRYTFVMNGHIVESANNNTVSISIDMRMPTYIGWTADMCSAATTRLWSFHAANELAAESQSMHHQMDHGHFTHLTVWHIHGLWRAYPNQPLITLIKSELSSWLRMGCHCISNDYRTTPAHTFICQFSPSVPLYELFPDPPIIFDLDSLYTTARQRSNSIHSHTKI